MTAPLPTGQKLLDSLAETWDFFFSDVLPMLQAIFYPVQVGGPALGREAQCPCRAHPGLTLQRGGLPGWGAHTPALLCAALLGLSELLGACFHLLKLQIWTPPSP